MVVKEPMFNKKMVFYACFLDEDFSMVSMEDKRKDFIGSKFSPNRSSKLLIYWLSSDMENQSNPVYLYEVDDLLGGDALSLYDLASLARNDIRWLPINRGKDYVDRQAA